MRKSLCEQGEEGAPAFFTLQSHHGLVHSCMDGRVCLQEEVVQDGLEHVTRGSLMLARLFGIGKPARLFGIGIATSSPLKRRAQVLHVMVP